MTPLEIEIEVQSLRLQLEALEAKLRSARLSGGHTFADLRGMLKNEVHTTPEEIEAAKFKGPSEDQW